MVRLHGLCYWTLLASLCVGGLIIAWKALAWDPASLLGDYKEQPPTARYLFSFGDSFSSTGFDVHSTNYPTLFHPLGNPPFPGHTSCGRGPNWAGVLVRDHAPEATMLYNFAVVGATINQSIVASHDPDAVDFTRQITQFRDSLGTKPAPAHAKWKRENSAAIIWMGTNDVVLSFSQALIGLSTATDPEVRLNDRLLTSYIRQLDSLVVVGVRNFVLVNIPPINQNPNFATGDPAIAQMVERDVHAFNEKFAKRLSTWNANHEHSAVHILDTQPIFRQILKTPHDHNATNAACIDKFGKTCLWSDKFHPGLAIQRTMGRKIYEALDSIGFWEESPIYQ